MRLQTRSPAPIPRPVSIVSKKDQAALDMQSLVEEKCMSSVYISFRDKHAQFRRKELSMVRFVQDVADMIKEPYPEVWSAFAAYAPTAFKKWQEYATLRGEVLSAIPNAAKHDDMSRLLVELNDELVPMSSGAFLDKVQALMCGRVLCTAPMLWIAYPELWAVLVRSTSTKQWHARMQKQEAERRARLAVATMPKMFCSAEIFDLVADRTPLPSLGRLATTCLWVRMNLKAEKFAAAKERLILTCGLFDVRTDQLRLRNANEEVIAVSPMGNGIPSLWVRIGDFRYSTVSTSDCSVMLQRITDLIRLTDKTGKAWFAFEAAEGNGMPRIRISYKNGESHIKVRFVCIEAK